MMDALLGVLLLAAADATPRDCYHARSMTNLRLCGEDARQAETAMEKAYEDALARLSSAGQEAERKSFAAAQKSWLAYRKEFCTSISKRWGAGSIRDQYHQACMMERARQRASELSHESEREPAPPELPQPHPVPPQGEPLPQ